MGYYSDIMVDDGSDIERWSDGERREIYNEPEEKVEKYKANQKLWKVIREPDGYYYEIKLAGMVIERIKIEYPAINVLKANGVIK